MSCSLERGGCFETCSSRAVVSNEPLAEKSVHVIDRKIEIITWVFCTITRTSMLFISEIISGSHIDFLFQNYLFLSVYQAFLWVFDISNSLKKN